MHKLFGSVFLLFVVQYVSAFTVKGVVTDAGGERLSFANIYINGTSNGTSANLNGEYHLTVQAGTYDLVFQHIGYKQQVQHVVINKDVELNVTLETVAYEVSDVLINGNDDPANQVIRKAIAKRKYFLEAVESYSCDAYVKGVQRITDAPFWAKNRIKKAGYTIGSDGIVYLSESVSKLYYTKPNKFHEDVYSSRVSGNSQGFTFNSAQDFYFNFYERNITIPVIATRPFISPLSESAFSYYKFKMLGAYKEGDRLINKIQVTPKRKSDPCFSGVLSIVEDNWNIHSLELYLVKDNGLEYVDTLKITQYFIPTNDNLWLPSQQRYDVKAGVLGIKGDGYYLGVFKNYQVNNHFGMVAKTDTIKPAKKVTAKKKAGTTNTAKTKEEKKVEQKIFTPEVIKIEQEANKRDTVYWDSIRPMPLTEIESSNYVFKDSIQVIKDSKEYKDSTDKELNKPTALGIITGYTYSKQYSKISIGFPSLLNIVNFNPVEGLNFQLRFSVFKNFSKTSRRGGRTLLFEPSFRYGVLNKQFNAMGKFVFRNSQIHDEYISLSGGRYISQFNEEQPQPEFGNTWKSIVLRISDFKIYEQYFIRAAYSRELHNGIYGSIAVNYAKRTPLENSSEFTIFKKTKRVYTPNGVELPDFNGENYNITEHSSLRVDLQFRFVFKQQYITRPDYRIRTPDPRYPELTINYKKAIPINGFSDLNYDYLEAQLTGSIAMKQAGTLWYRFGGGGFPNARNIQYSDYKHFYGRFLNMGQTDLLGFYTIGFYRHSTNQYFAEAHLEQHFGGLLFDRLPGWRKLKWKEVIGFHFLYTPVRQQYFQLDAGIENILKVLRVDFIAGFGSGKNEYYFGARTGLTIDFSR